MRKAFLILVSVLSSTSLLTAQQVLSRPLPNGSYTALGDIDLDTHCKILYGNNSYVYLFGGNRGNAYSWRCIHRSNAENKLVSVDIDVDQACKDQYQNPNAYSGYRNLEDPNSWVCVK